MLEKSFPGRARRTPKSVRVVDRTARSFITAGGFGTIIALTLMFVFLLSVVLPLFQAGEIEHQRDYPALADGEGDRAILGAGVDELRLAGWVLRRDGTLTVFKTFDGRVLNETRIFEGARVTSWSFSPDGPQVAFGFANGTIRHGVIDFSSDFREADAMPEPLRDRRPGDTFDHLGAMYVVTPELQFRRQTIRVELSEPLATGDHAIDRIDYSIRAAGDRVFVALTSTGRLTLYLEELVENMATGETESTLSETALPYQESERGVPLRIMLAGTGTTLFLLWKDGYCERYDLRSDVEPQIAETTRLLEEGVALTAVRFLVGKTTLMVGDSGGALRAWFVTKPWHAGTVDGGLLTMAHSLVGAGSAVTALYPSRRTRLLAAGYADGGVKVFYVTTDLEVVSADAAFDAPVTALAFGPKEDALLAITRGDGSYWHVDPAHPSATFGSLFGKVWYEGYAEPEHVWQSTGGTDDFEPKFGLMPLIFGTLKATLYAMLIAAPLGLLAAVFTSEFLDPKWRTPVKSSLEMMASLPSVVLGFLAALIIAPFVETVVPALLVSFLTIPFAILLGARLWQLLPTRLAVRWSQGPRLVAILLFLPMGAGLASALGPWAETTWFGGDIRLWLNGGPGGGTGGWLLLLMPFSILAVALAVSRYAGPWLRSASRNWSRLTCALVDIGKFLGMAVAAFVLAWIGAKAMGALGYDPRGGVLDTYAQRNALILGFVMGFAVVPVIYTIAEDALTSVPQALREGSLGAGATPWQTAWRIVIPTAMSGLFGALMVGLGRAVGETMIVLMAAGNTPIMEWNIFNGFRTLSANIAVELPEAVKDDTHYRALFLAALVLFAMTFLVNTLAEMVRRVFRRKFAEL